MHPRAPVELDVRYRLASGAEWANGRARDLSSGGLGLAVADKLEVGATMESVRFTLPERDGDAASDVELAAKIVRRVPADDRELPFVVGLQFLDSPQVVRERLSRYVFRRLREAVEAGEIEGPAHRIPFAKPIAIRFELFKDFVSEISANLSTTGMFIHTSKPRPVGSVFDFRFEMGEDFTIIEGRGEVVWVREKRVGPDSPPGMGVRFVSLDSASTNVIRRMVEDYVQSGFTPFDLEAQIAPDLPLGDGEQTAEERAEAESARPAMLEEIEAPREVSGIADLGAEIDGEERGDQLERELTSAVAERDQLARRLRITRDEKEALQRELAAVSAEERRTEVDNEVARLEDRLAAAAKTEAALTRQLEESETTAAASAEERDELARRVADLEGEKETLRREMDAERESAGTAASSLTALEDKIGSLRTSRDAAEGALASARREIELLQEKLIGHDEQTTQLEDRLRALAGERDGLASEREKLAGERDELAARLDEARREVEDAAREGERQRAEVEAELAAARQDSQKQLARISDYEERSADSSTSTLQLRSRVGHLEKENELQRRELAAETAAREDLIEKSERALAEAEAARGELAELERELERRQRELDAEFQQRQSLAARSESAEAELDEFRFLVSELEKFGLQRQQELDEQVGQHLGLLGEKESAIERIRSLEERLAEAEREAAENREELQSRLDRERESAEKETATLRERLAELEQESDERRSRHADELTRRQEEHEAEAGELRQRIGELKEAAAESRKETDAEIERRHEAAAEIEELRGELADLGQESERLRQQLEQTEARSASAEDEAKELRRRIAEVEEERDARVAEDEVEELRRRIAEVEKDRDARVAEARSSLDATRVEAEAESAGLREQISGLEQEAAERATDFEKRAHLAESEARELRRKLDALQGDHEELAREASAAADRAAASAARLGDLEDELLASRETAAEREVRVAVPKPAVEELATQRRGVRPAQIAAGLLIGVLALLAWQRLGLPLPGDNRGDGGQALASAPTDAAPEASGPIPQGTPIVAPPAAGTADPPSATGGGEVETEGAPAAGDEPAPAVTGPDPAALESAVLGWAQAWSAQSVDDYLASYAPEFTPDDGMSRPAWEAQRRDRVSRPASLAIELGPLTNERLSDDRYRVTFRQSYRSPTYEDEVVKTLEMVWVDERWKIAAETSL